MANLEKQREATMTACQKWLDVCLAEIAVEMKSSYGINQYTIPVPYGFRNQLDSMAHALERAGYGVNTEFEDRITISW